MTTPDPKEQWLADRQNSVGGSEAATVMGINPFDTEFKLYMRKSGLMPRVEETEAMRMGHVMEPVIAQRYEVETGRETFDPGEYEIARRVAHEDMHATIDRLIRPMITPKGISTVGGVLQLKNVGTHMGKHWEEGLPLYVQVQIQHEMFVTSSDWGSGAAIIGGSRFVWQDVDINQKFCTYLAERCAAFMRAVREGRPPEAKADDTDALRTLYPKHEPGKTKELSPDLMALDDELQAAVADMRRARRKVLKCSNRIKQAVGSAERGVLPDGTTYTYTSKERKGYTVRPATVRRLRRLK